MITTARISLEKLDGLSPDYVSALRSAAVEKDGFLYLDISVANAIKAKHNPKKMRGLGDLVHAIAAPIGRALSLDCFDAKGKLKESSPCGQRRETWNKIIPF